MHNQQAHSVLAFWGRFQRRAAAFLWRWVIHLRPRKAKAFRGYRPSMQTLIGISQPCGLTSDRVRSISVGGGIQRGQRLLWPEESKETGGFVAEDPTGTASPWHTTLLARSSVLYLRPRLTRKRSVSVQERSFCSAGKRAGFCERERAKRWPVSGGDAGI